MKHTRYVVAFAVLCALVTASLPTAYSQTKFEPYFRGELSSDSVKISAVRVVLAFGTQQDTFLLQARSPVIDSLNWDTTKLNLDSAGIYKITYLVTYKDGQVVPYNRWVTTLGNATVSSADKADIAKRTADTLQARGFPSAGVGNTRCSVYVRDTALDVNIEGTDIMVLNAGGQRVTWSSTNSSGYVVFRLDSTSTYQLAAAKTGYIFPLTESFPVTQAVRVDTVRGYGFIPPAPPAAYLHNVWGWIYDVSGSGKSGVLVTAKLSRRQVVFLNVVISAYEVSDTTDTAGYWLLQLMSNDSLSPIGTEYAFRAEDSGRLVGATSLPITTNQQLDWTR